MKKNIIKYFVGFILVTISNSCTYIENVQLLIGGKIEQKNFVQAIPFEWRKDLIIVKAFINKDTVPREFIFDTGAFNSKVEGNLANNLNLPVVTKKTNSTAQGISQEIEVVLMNSIQLGEIKFYNIGAGKVYYNPTSASPCIAKNGIIGANLIKLAHWKIDYQNQLLYFSDKPFEIKDKGYTIPFKRPVLSGTPKISLEVEGEKIENILLDLGFNGGLVLPISLANHFESDDTQIILDHSTSGIYGTNVDSIIVKKLKINIGGFTKYLPVEFSALNKALLGNEFLKHFNVSIDYTKKKIYLKKYRDVLISDPSNFLVGIQNDTTWVVNRTNSNLSLQLGDTLLHVNGLKPYELFDSYCDYILNIQRLLEMDSLVVQKADKSFLTIDKSFK